MLPAAFAVLPEIGRSIPTLLTLWSVPRCPPCNCSPIFHCGIPELVCPDSESHTGYVSYFVILCLGFVGGVFSLWYALPYIPTHWLRRRVIRGETAGVIALRKKHTDSSL